MKMSEGSIVTLLLEFAASWVEEDPETNVLEKSCGLFSDLQKQIHSDALKSAPWLKSALAFLKRFEKSIASFGKGWAVRQWKSSGPKEISTVLGSCKHVPPELQGVLLCAKNASLFKNLPPVQEDSKDLQLILKAVKKGLTIASLDMDILANFLVQEDLDKVEGYKKSIMTALDNSVKRTETDKEKAFPLFEKYRRDTGVSVSHGSFHPGILDPSFVVLSTGYFVASQTLELTTPNGF